MAGQTMILTGIILHDFECIFYQLDELGCESIQIRIYKEIGYEELLEIVKKSSNLNFRYLNILIPYPLMDDFMFQLIRMTENYTYIHLSLYNTPIDIVKQKKKVPRISLIHQNISSADDCGVINRKNLSFFSIQTYMENILYNSCLNRKICIDEFGDIKNCPSMSFSYGNIISYKLKDISSKESFRKYWQINKSQISVCKDCEYRNMCSDCRAFICNEKDIYSKPLKCNYDPYQCCWGK